MTLHMYSSKSQSRISRHPTSDLTTSGTLGFGYLGAPSRAMCHYVETEDSTSDPGRYWEASSPSLMGRKCSGVSNLEFMFEKVCSSDNSVGQRKLRLRKDIPDCFPILRSDIDSNAPG